MAITWGLWAFLLAFVIFILCVLITLDNHDDQE
jgi:hypothetical protein